MKKYIKIFILLVVLILASTITVFASSATAELKLSKEQVQKGDEFTVTLNVSCEDGINGLTGEINYDESELELVKTEIVDTTKWGNLGEDLNLAILHLSTDTIKTADIVKITFKVKDTVEVGTKSNITISDIEVDSDAATNSTAQVGTKEVEINIIEEQNTEPTPTEPTPTEPTITEPTPTEPTITEPGDEISNAPNSSTSKDNTESDNKIPYTGLSSIMVIISVISALTVVCYVRYNKYKQI